MTTPIQQKIRNKIRTARQIAEMIKPGDWIRPGHCGSSPIEFEAAVADKIGEGGEAFRKKPVELWYIGHFPPGRIAQTDPDGKYSIQHNDFVFPWARRQNDKTGIPEFVQLEWAFHTSWQYARWAHPEKEKCGLDWSAAASSPPNAHGFFNFAYGTAAAWQILQCAKNRVLEVREDYPNALGWCHNTINVDDVDYIIEADCEKFPFIQVTEPSSDPITEKIAENIVELMEDGDCVQLGIGALPTAVCDAISRAGLKKLGVHTEMLQEGLMRLIESGSVDNSLKPIDTGKSTWSFAFHFNNKRYYDFVHNNPELIVYDINYTNNPLTLVKIPHMVAIDNFVAIDLLGQICTGFHENHAISGVGGYYQFISGSALSKGGRAFSTATSTRKMADGTVVSRIVPSLPRFSTVDCPAFLVTWVVTEYGAVNLAGCSSYERAKKLISIAHPDFREDLERESYNNGLFPKGFVLNPDRRYPEYKKLRDWKMPLDFAEGFDYSSGMWSGK